MSRSNPQCNFEASHHAAEFTIGKPRALLDGALVTVLQAQIQRLRDELATSRQSLSDHVTELDRAKQGVERHVAAVSQWRDDCQTEQKRAADLESQLLALQTKYMQARAEKRSAAAKSTAALRELEEQVLSLTAFVGQSDVK